MTLDISVIMPVWNESLHIEEALRSVATQRGVAFEVIVIDDQSTDDTFAIVERLAKEFPSIRLVRNPVKGKVAAINHGFTLALAPWTAFFAGDDIMPPDSLATRWNAVKDVVSVRPVVGLCRLVTLSEDKSQDGLVVPRDPAKGAFSGVSYLMDKRALGIFFPIPEQLPNEDTWMEIVAQHVDLELVVNPVIGCAWRIHAGNSINMRVAWPEFNHKFTIRMEAARVFLDKFGSELTPAAHASVSARVACEEARRRGSIPGILSSGVGTIAKLRAISLSGPLLYAIRKRLYTLFSGW